MDAVLRPLSPSVQSRIPSRETGASQSGHKEAHRPISQVILSLIKLLIDINHNTHVNRDCPFVSYPPRPE